MIWENKKTPLANYKQKIFCYTNDHKLIVTLFYILKTINLNFLIHYWIYEYKLNRFYVGRAIMSIYLHRYTHIDRKKPGTF